VKLEKHNFHRLRESVSECDNKFLRFFGKKKAFINFYKMHYKHLYWYGNKNCVTINSQMLN